MISLKCLLHNAATLRTCSLWSNNNDKNDNDNHGQSDLTNGLRLPLLSLLLLVLLLLAYLLVYFSGRGETVISNFQQQD